MRKLLIIGFATLVAIPISCSLFSPADYFPLALNNVWHYVFTTTTVMKGTVDTTITTTDSTYTEIVAETTLSGKKAWKFTDHYGASSSSSYIVEESDRILQYGSPTDSEPSTWLKLPLAQNATWVMDSMSYAGKVTATVKAKESVTVPAGTFGDAWRVEYVFDSMPTSPWREWFAAGVGLAKFSNEGTSSTPDETTTVTMTQELTGYTVK